jgi:hypothetical protein
MTRLESSYKTPMFTALLFAALLAGGGIGKTLAAVDPGVTLAPGALAGAATEPTVVSSSPSDRATAVPTSSNTSENVVTGAAATATFSQPMDPATINSSSAGDVLTFTVRETTGSNVPGTVVMNAANTVATFTPTWLALNPNTSYTATVTTAAKNAGGVAMAIAQAIVFRGLPSSSTVRRRQTTIVCATPGRSTGRCHGGRAAAAIPG